MVERFAMNKIISDVIAGYNLCFCKMNKIRSGENSGYNTIGRNMDKAHTSGKRKIRRLYHTRQLELYYEPGKNKKRRTCQHLRL